MNEVKPEALSADCMTHHGSARLLVVDDEPEFLAPLCEFLSRSGYEVKGVTSGSDALAELKKRAFDVLLTDLIMPEMDGAGLLQAALEIEPELVAIVITGHGTIPSAVEAMKGGAFDYMIKPLEFRTLVHTLDRALTVRRLRMENVQLRETLDVYMLKEALRETGNFYRTIFENTGTAMSIVEEDATISLVNAEFEKLSGYSKHEIEGKKKWMEFVLKDDLERIQQYYRMASAEPDPHPRNFEFRFLDRNGAIKDIFMTAAVIPGTGKGLAALIDITERKEAEEKVQSYQRALRSLASALSVTEERERRRIAMDLHDNIGQLLALTQIKLGVLGKEASSGDLRSQVDEIGKLVAQAILFTRSLTAELSPPVLHQLGFSAAMEWLVEETQKQHGIRVDFGDDKRPKPMSEEMQTILFKVARELLVNVVKHAQASRASVSIERNGNELMLIVEDNGTGFNPSIIEPGKSRGFGLFNVRERLENIGGRIEVESGPARGARVIATVPLES